MSARRVARQEVETWLNHTVSYVMSRLGALRYDPEILDEETSKTLCLSVYLDQGVSPANIRAAFVMGHTWLKGITGLPHIGFTVIKGDGVLTARYLVDTSDRSLSSETSLSFELGLRSILDEAGVISPFRIPYRARMKEFIKAKEKYRGKALEIEVERILSSPVCKALDAKVVAKILKLVFPEGQKAA